MATRPTLLPAFKLQATSYKLMKQSASKMPLCSHRYAVNLLYGIEQNGCASQLQRYFVRGILAGSVKG
jgi:hypothetical protein